MTRHDGSWTRPPHLSCSFARPGRLPSVRFSVECDGSGTAPSPELPRDLYGTESPSYNRAHIVKRLAYRIQELAYGGLSEATRDQLREHLENERLDTETERVTRMTRRQTKNGVPVVGTRIVRDWHGERHEVTVVQGGFEYEGRRYRSLSAIARAITGTRWNGPAFFGLRKPEREKGARG